MTTITSADLRNKSIGLYTPPFRFEHGYIWDAKGQMVADNHVDGEDAALRIRGWGRISYMENPEALQDEVGNVIALAMTEFWERSKAERDSEPYGFTDGDRRGMIYEPQYADRLNNPIPIYRHAQPAPDREQVRSEHAEWSQVTFGNVGPIGPLKHLRREVLEVIAKPHDLIEWADMQFLLWDAQRRAGITDEQITQAMIEKLAVNKQREWPEPKDGEPRLHIKGQPVPDGFPPDEIECDICGHVSTDPEGRHYCCEDNSDD